MGLCQSNLIRYQIEQNKRIEKELQIASKVQGQTQKLLLLGAAECGKSTILKQMRILHDNGFSPDELDNQRSLIYSNTIQGMLTMIRAMDNLGVVPKSAKMQRNASILREVVQTDQEYWPFTKETYEALKQLWADEAVQECFSRRAEYHLHDGVRYFMDELDRIAAEDFVPTNQDVLHTRVPTNGVVEVRFQVERTNFRVFDVGGQRSERRKWIHCFDSVNAIIFICALSEFDQKLVEDDQTNRLRESMILFKQICNSSVFSDNCSMILFLNKKDLFAEKIKKSSITIAFPEYKGNMSYEAQAKYIERRFERLNENTRRQIYAHYTCATDTNQVQVVLDSVVDTVMRANITNAGML